MSVPVRNALPRRILIVRLGAIGDVANALVLATALRDADPGVEIGWAVHELALPLVERHPAVARVHLWPKQRAARALVPLVRALREQRYELAIDLQRLAKSATLARLSGAPRVLGFDRARCKEQSWRLLSERLAPEPAGTTGHRVDWYLEFARHLGLSDARARHELPADSAAEARAEELFPRTDPAPVLIGVGASKPANRWPPAYFGRLAAALAREATAPLVLVGAPSDRPAADAVLAAAGPGASVRDLVGRTSLLDLIALSRRARLFIGGDTGPLHVAAAAGARVLALFGAADPARTGPWPPTGDRHRVLFERPHCAPCLRRTCNQPRHLCMEDLSVERALAAARELLSGAGAGGNGTRPPA